MKKLLLKSENYVNCYFLVDKGRCYVVDPGGEKEKLRDYVKENKLEVVGILLTHAHIDHICAIDAFNVPIYIHRKEYEVFIDNYNSGFMNLGKEVPFVLEKLRIILIRDNDILPLNDKKIKAIHTPGHTIGGVCYKYGDDLYTGDTLFHESVGRWDLPTGSLNDLKKSVVHLIDSNDENVRVHPSHGESSTIGDEKIENYFYKEWKAFIN